MVHLQIDEKYVSIKGEKNKKRLYTGTIFKGRYLYGKNKDKAKLLNKTVFSAKTVKDLAEKSNALTHYADEKYDGCSQECMNSRIYSVRFGKLTNKFKFSTIIKLAEIKEAVINKSKLKLAVKGRKIESTNLISSKEYMEIEKYVIDTSGMTKAMRKLFTEIKYGR